MKTTPNHGLSYVEGNDKPADYPLISQENMTKLDTLIQQLIDGKAPFSHNHSIGQIMGLTEDLAAKADQQATATALAGKASSSHTHTMDGITGLTAALASKANATTLDARVPSTMALRRDTSVGTRIFAGTTMIHGDTGQRDIGTLLSSKSTTTPGRVSLRRVGHTVALTFRIVVFDVSGVSAWSEIMTLPPGFRPHSQFRFIGDTAGYRVFECSPSGAITTTNLDIKKGEIVSFHVSFLAPDVWPSVLPGGPA